MSETTTPKQSDPYRRLLAMEAMGGHYADIAGRIRGAVDAYLESPDDPRPLLRLPREERMIACEVPGVEDPFQL